MFVLEPTRSWLALICGRGVDRTFALDPSLLDTFAGLDLSLAITPTLNGNIPGYGRITGFRSARPRKWITASGDGVNDRKHGQQFKALFARIGSKLCRYRWGSHFWEGNDRQGSRPAAQFRDPQAVRTGGRHTALSMDQDWDLGMREDLNRLTSEDNSGDAATTV